jgi:riboflavin synthase
MVKFKRVRIPGKWRQEIMAVQKYLNETIQTTVLTLGVPGKTTDDKAWKRVASKLSSANRIGPTVKKDDSSKNRLFSIKTG